MKLASMALGGWSGTVGGGSVLDVWQGATWLSYSQLESSYLSSLSSRCDGRSPAVGGLLVRARMCLVTGLVVEGEIFGPHPGKPVKR